MVWPRSASTWLGSHPAIKSVIGGCFHWKIHAWTQPSSKGLPGIFLATALNDEWEESLTGKPICKGQCLFYWKMNTHMDPTIVPNRASWYFLSNRSEWRMGGILGQGNLFCLQGTVPIRAKCLGIDIIDYMLLKTLWEPGNIDGSESLSPFHLFTSFDQGLVVVLFCWLGGFGCFCSG